MRRAGLSDVEAGGSDAARVFDHLIRFDDAYGLWTRRRSRENEPFPGY